MANDRWIDVQEMTPREFLVHVVKPNVEDLANDFSSVRHAYNAVAAVDALAARIFYCLRERATTIMPKGDDTKYRDTVATEFPDFGILRDLAKVLKHGELTRGRPVVTSTVQMSCRLLWWDTDKADTWDGPRQVVVRTNTGEELAVVDVVAKALVVLEAEMVAYSI